MDRGSRIGTADRRAAGPAHSPRHILEMNGESYRLKQSKRKRGSRRIPDPPTTRLDGRPPPPRQTRLGEEDVFRCGLNAPPFQAAQASAPDALLPDNPNLLPVALVYWSTFTPPLWSTFIPPLTACIARRRQRSGRGRATERGPIHKGEISVLLRSLDEATMTPWRS